MHADAINDLPDGIGKITTMSEMSQKMGLKSDFEKKIKVQTRGIKKNCKIKELKMVNFHDSFTNLYKRFFVLS